MATKKIQISTAPSKSDIIDLFADYCLMHGHKPASVYKFAKDNGFEEAEFYKYFSSFETLERFYFTEMFAHTMETLEKSPAYADFSGLEKLSAFYFTFFEMATANRSFVVYSLTKGSSNIKNLLKLKELRREFTVFAQSVLEKPFETKHPRADKLQQDTLREGAWMQFLTILKFWLKDTSPGFEKTDVFIEKSVKASGDLVYNSPLQSLFDLGKFVWKEKFTV
ncbi:TetR/AcrR family transcriptional regulator [Flavobacterium rhizosphaerae]|uniref:TetR family transcriptional regulator C-terminal domain-containing protein n=1 Tax=Flavobacterium rhizosphaerae TaxID=3163298 RepID=A0ABW8YX60_9FLAO